MASATIGWAAGINATGAVLERYWPQAVEEGLVTGTVDEALRRFVESKKAASLSSDLLEAIYVFLLRAADQPIEVARLVQDGAFLSAFESLYDQAVRGDWSTARWRGAVTLLLSRFSVSPAGAAGAALLTFLFSTLLAPYFNIARRKVVEEPQIQLVMPYLIYRSRDDDRVRPNHQALHGFVAAANWPGWDNEVLPPHGWRCRCGVDEVPWTVAVDRGWSGTFPLGTSKLLEFRRLGGSDAGFPRDQFVTAVAHAVAA